MDAIKFELLMNLIGIKTKGRGIDAGSITSGTIDPARLPESGMTSLFMYNDASDISTYKKLSSSPSSGGVQTVVVASATGTGVAQAWATDPGSPNKTYIPIGIIHSHVHAKKTGAGNVTLACEIYKRTVGGVETLLFTTDSTPNLTTAETSYNLEQYNDAIVSLNSSDRIVIKYVYTVTSGTPTITIYFEDAYLSRVEMPFSNVTPSTYDASVIVSGTMDISRMSYMQYPIALLGDSIAGQNTASSSTQKSKASNGIIAWMLAYLGQPWDLQPTDNYAIGGTGTNVVLSTQMPLLQAAVAAGRRYSRVFINTGTNDTNASRSIVTVKSEFTQIYAAVRALGAIPVQMPILPRGIDVSLTTAKKQNQQLNSWFASMAAQGLIEYIPYHENVADNSTAYGNALTSTMEDSGTYNLHPNCLGAALLGKTAADIMAARGFNIAQPYATQQSDKFDRSNNPYGVCFDSPNPLLQGGTTAPTGMTSSGGTWSKLVRTLSNGQTRSYPKCVLADSTTHYLYDDRVSSGAWAGTALQPGDVIEGRALVEISAGVNITRVQLSLTENDGATQSAAIDLASSSGLMPDGNHILHLKTPKLTVRQYAGSGNASIFARIDIITGSGASGDVVVKAFEVRMTAQ